MNSGSRELKPASLFVISAIMMILTVSYSSWSFLLFFLFTIYFEMIKHFKSWKQFLVILLNIFIVSTTVFINSFFIDNMVLFLLAVSYYSILITFEVYVIWKLLNKKLDLILIFMACILYRLPLYCNDYILPFYWTSLIQVHPLSNFISEFMLPLFFEAVCICISIIMYKMYLRSITIIHIVQLFIILSFTVTATITYKYYTGHNPVDGKIFKCTIIQGGFSALDYRLMAKYPGLIDKSTAAYMSYIENNYNANLLILPESAFFGEQSIEGSVPVKLRELAKKNNMNIYASFLREEDGKIFNSVALINNRGEITSIYNKNNPMYLIETGRIERGNNTNVFILNEYKIAPLICFDAVFPRNFYRGTVPDIYLVTSNNVFAENTVLTKLHQAYAVINARTISKPLLQVVQNGPSFYVTKNGKLHYISKQYETVKGMSITIE